MKITAIFWCINTKDFLPINEKLSFRINNIDYPVKNKPGGFYFFLKEILFPADIEIFSKNFFYKKFSIENFKHSEIITIELMPKNIDGAAQIKLNNSNFTRFALGWDYFKINKSLQKGDDFIFPYNPAEISLEGRKFLIKDTSSSAEEFIQISSTKNLTFSQFDIPPIENNYDKNTTALLPVFDIYNTKKDDCIYVFPPDKKEYSVWIYYNDSIQQISLNV